MFSQSKSTDAIWRVGITEKELSALQAVEVITSGDYVTSEIGHNGHFSITAMEANGKDIKVSCHTKSINQMYSPLCFNLPREASAHVST